MYVDFQKVKDASELQNKECHLQFSQNIITAIKVRWMDGCVRSTSKGHQKVRLAQYLTSNPEHRSSLERYGIS